MRMILKRHGPSNGGRALAREMGINMMRLEGSRFQPRPGDRVINWGSSDRDGWDDEYYLNTPRAVGQTRDKIKQYEAFEWHGVPCPVWTTDPQTARHWLCPEGPRVLTRALTRGSQGRGIEAFSYEGSDWTADYNAFLHREQTPLYVQVFGRNPLRVTEYRIHVVNGRVIDRQQKRRRSDNERGSNPYIRSASNGWVFCRGGCEHHEGLDQAATQAVEALGLDFGAVDCARSEDGDYCIYEVNTAPGLEGTTLQSYARAFGGSAA